MQKLRSRITQTLSTRISLVVVCAIAVLLLLAVFIVLRFSYRAIRKDAIANAQETLEYTVQHIDNVLLSVEQSAGNIYWDLQFHLDDPDRMFTYCRQLLDSNPYIIGCAIAMKPGHFKGREPLFMAYYYRDGMSPDATLVRSKFFAGGLYVEQEWYTRPMTTRSPCWIDPLKTATAANEAITTFSVPIYNREGDTVGVLGLDVSTVLLSNIIQSAKPTPHSYALLMGQEGSFAVYPDSSKLYHQGEIMLTAAQADPSVKKVVKAMTDGEEGYCEALIDDANHYVFYKPFVRSLMPGRAIQELGWSAAVVLPEDDFMGSYTRMRNAVILVAFAGLLLLLLLCRYALRRQLMPLRRLTLSAQRIAEGQYGETVAFSRHQDEVGIMQNHFGQMQQALSGHIGELQRLTSALREHGDQLEKAYEQAKEADAMKTAVLHNMTNQMLAPVNAIGDDVDQLFSHHGTLDDASVERLTTDIEQQGQKATQLLDQLLADAQRADPQTLEL